MIDTQKYNMADRVGDHASHHLTTLQADQTVRQSLDFLRFQDLAEKIVYFYVVDSERHLVGVVPVRRLLMGAPETRISSIMVPGVFSVSEDDTLLAASELLVAKRYMAVPVVDRSNRLTGVIDVTLFADESVQAAHRQEREDIFQLLGVHISLGRKGSALFGYRDRFPWLLCNVGAGLICAMIVGAYEKLMLMMSILPFFIPVVLALAESVSMQSTTLALQGLYHRRHSWSIVWRALKREFSVACLLGASCGLVVALFAYIWKGSTIVSVAVGGAISLSVVTSCILGVLVPGLIRGMRVDPKISSGPVVLALADIATLVTFFSLAGWLVEG